MTGASIRKLDHVEMVWDRQSARMEIKIRDNDGNEYTYVVEDQRFCMLNVDRPAPPQTFWDDVMSSRAYPSPPPNITFKTAPNPINEGGRRFE